MNLLRAYQSILSKRIGTDAAEALVGDMIQEYEGRRATSRPRAFWWLIRECASVALRSRAKRPHHPRVAHSSLFGGVMSDVRFAFRTLRRSPGFTLGCALTLGIGVGATTTFYSVADAVLISPLSYPDGERIYRLGMAPPGDQGGTGIFNVAPALVFDWARELQSFESVAGAIHMRMAISSSEPEFLAAAAVTETWASVFSIDMQMGRWFDLSDRASPGPIVILSHGLWTRLGGSSDIVGEQVILNDTPHTVVGVLSPAYEGPVALRMGTTDVLVPIEQSGRDLTEKDNWFVAALAKLRPDVSPSAARYELEQVTNALAESYPPVGEGPPVPRMRSLRNLTVGSSASTIWMLLGASAVLLVIACINVAHLLLARSMSRTGEFALRTAIGAGRGRLIRQVFVESLVIAWLGGSVGVALSLMGVETTRAFAPTDISRLDQIAVNPSVLAFAGAIAMLTGLIFGMAPAWLASRTAKVENAMTDRRITGDRATGLAQRTLVAAEVALAMVTAVGGALLANSFARLVQVDPGFDAHGIVELELSARTPYESREARIALFDDIAERLAAVPGMQRISMTNGQPFGGANAAGSYVLEDADAPPNDYVGWQLVGPDFFATLAAPIVSGRPLTETDFRATPAGIIVNQAFERQHFGNASSVGHRMKVIDSEPEAPWLTIVGVVRDMSPGDLSREPLPQVYVPFTVSRIVFDNVSFLARTSLPIETVAASMREAVWSVDANQPITTITPLTARIHESLVGPRFYLFLFGGFGLIGLALTLSGTYGAVAYAVAQRHSEIGIRLALGARNPDIVRLVLRMGVTPAMAGLVVGVITAGFLSRFLSSFVFGINTTDAPTYVGVAFGLLGAAVLACWFPARRAARVDPLLTLRGR